MFPTCVRGSHARSGENAYSDYPDKLIAEKYGKDICSFKLPRGSVIIYNTFGVHRAKPVEEEAFVRKSLFFQADATLSDAEKIIVNTAFIERLDDELKMYLGFGLPGDYADFPQTGLESLPSRREITEPLIEWLGKSLPPSPMRVVAREWIVRAGLLEVARRVKRATNGVVNYRFR